MSWPRRACCALLVVVANAATPASAQPLKLLDVPFISQSEALCGGAAAAMVLRYWGAQGVAAESFAHLVDRSAAGIRTDALVDALVQRGYTAAGIRGSDAAVAAELQRGRPTIALIEDRPGTYHYIVIVGFHDRGVVLHDPARAAFQVMSRAEFARRWEPADQWMLVLAPPAAAEPGAAVSPSTADGSSCEVQIAQGVREAQANRLDEADRILTAAVSCPGSAAFRELAGVRLLQRRWAEVRSLSEAALEEDPTDAYAWKLLGTARFVANEEVAALEAWNHVQEPKVDLLRVDGLRRTRQRVVERLSGVAIGDVLTPATFRRAQRSVAELPSSVAGSAAYVPAGSGTVQLRISVAERSLFSVGPLALAALGVRAAANREIELGLTSMTGGGERLSGSWRFWPHRPAYRVSFASPAPWRGIWQLSGSYERQPFTATFAASERLTSTIRFGRWQTAALRWYGGLGLDRWRGERALGAVAGGIRLLSRQNRLELQADAGGWLGSSRFSTLQATAALRTSAARQGVVLVARASAGVVSAGTPPDLWLAADTGHVRAPLSRAHPVADDGRFRTERLGRRLAAGTIEAQRWFRVGPASIAPALFVDISRVQRRLHPGAVGDVDAGGGLRIGAPGIGGTLRLDLAKGIRDGATALSLVYEP